MITGEAFEPRLLISKATSARPLLYIMLKVLSSAGTTVLKFIDFYVNFREFSWAFPQTPYWVRCYSATLHTVPSNAQPCGFAAGDNVMYHS